MEIYSTEEEQVEALKRWWDKNGTKVIIGLVAVLAAVFGFKTWQQQQATEAAAASIQFQNMNTAMEQAPDKAEQAGRELLGSHGDSAYAAFAAFNLARIAVERGDYEQASAHLKTVMDRAAKPEFKQLAQLRLAKVRFAQGQYEEALSLVSGAEAGSFSSLYDETEGDILLAMGKRSEAYKAYSNALNGFTGSTGKRSQVELKLANLADAKDSVE